MMDLFSLLMGRRFGRVFGCTLRVILLVIFHDPNQFHEAVYSKISCCARNVVRHLEFDTEIQKLAEYNES